MDRHPWYVLVAVHCGLSSARSPTAAAAAKETATKGKCPSSCPAMTSQAANSLLGTLWGMPSDGAAACMPSGRVRW
jgi:hypothetical protein